MSILVNIIYLRKETPIYNIDELYLYEILDDYKDADLKIKEEIFRSFCSSIWSCDNKRRVFERDIKFSVASKYLDTEIGQIFNSWSSISYVTYKSMTKNLDYASLIRQKVNNIYSIMFDGVVCQRKDYMKLLRTPKNLYFRWIKGEVFDPDKLLSSIDVTISEAEALYEKYKLEKLDLPWNEYKKLVESYFLKMFNNVISLDIFENRESLVISTEAWHEDNFYISYFCKTLDGYFRNYQKEYYGITRNGKKSQREYLKRCKKCARLFKMASKNQVLCKKCSTYSPIGTKIIKCVDCGKDVEVGALNTKTCRCNECQKIRDRERKREWKRNSTSK